jgi:formylglycine-generating enzyme required for sulfatase activity
MMRLSKATAPPEFPEAWASDWGEDDYGLWMAFTFKGVRYGFRWIPPGSFLMGAGEKDPEGWTDETQHEVTLTHGFWLGETTVTQALWKAVVGENPSRFMGEDLPVENVSWDDCKAFMQALNTRQPALHSCLPSEAQWEYACRAETQTIFHFGDSITTDQVNYRGTEPLAGSPEGEYRQKTVPVKALPANAWGLYQMHGNVWEWCQDWLADYTAEPQHDPVGPDSGQDRVLRGGSWDLGGRGCRSASRDGSTPGLRDDGSGFRLARGQKEPEAGNK